MITSNGPKSFTWSVGGKTLRLCAADLHQLKSGLDNRQDRWVYPDRERISVMVVKQGAYRTYDPSSGGYVPKPCGAVAYVVHDDHGWETSLSDGAVAGLLSDIDNALNAGVLKSAAASTSVPIPDGPAEPCLSCNDTGMVELALTSKPCLDCPKGRAKLVTSGEGQ